jgi:hypothetical protein
LVKKKKLELNIKRGLINLPTKLSGESAMMYCTDSNGNQICLGEIKDYELSIKPETQQWEKDLSRWRQLKTKRLKKKYLKRLLEPYLDEVYPVDIAYNKWKILGLARLKKYKLF